MPTISGNAMSPHEEKSNSSERRDAVGFSKSESFDYQQHGPLRTVEPMTINNSSFNTFAKQNSQFNFDQPYTQFASTPNFQSGGSMPRMNVGNSATSFQSAPQFQKSDDSVRELCMLEKQLFEYDPSSGYTDGIIHAASEAYKSAYKLAEHHHKMHLVYLQEADNILMQYQMDKKADQDRMMALPSMQMNHIQHQTTLPMGMSNALNYPLNSSFVNVPRHFIAQLEQSTNAVTNLGNGMRDASYKRTFMHENGNETEEPVDSSQKKPRLSSPHNKVPSRDHKNDTTVSPSDSEKSGEVSKNVTVQSFQSQSETVEDKQIDSEDDSHNSEESLNSTEENTARTMIMQFGFDHFYQELCRYYDDHGHLNVPKKLKLRTNPLYLFIHEVQKLALKKANENDDKDASEFLTDERMNLLKSIGFPFLYSEHDKTTEIDNHVSLHSNHEKSADDAEFMEFYEQLKEFHNQFGHFDLERCMEIKYVKLANYMNGIRKQYMKMRDNISSDEKSDWSGVPFEFRERVKKLKSIGFL